jgi:hypothetical protein
MTPISRRRLAWWGAAALACAAVFAAYLDPTLVVELGNRLWACF